MFIRSKLDSKTGKQYIQLCKPFRNDNGAPSNKVIASFGSLDKLIDSGNLEKIIRSLSKFHPDFEIKPKSDLNIIEISRLNWGTPKILNFIWNTFDLNSFFSSVDSNVSFDFCSATFLMVLQRFLLPCSKLETFFSQTKYWNVQNIELHHLYRTLNILSSEKDNLEKFLFEKNRTLFNMEVDVVFFDATTIYFESKEEDNFRKFGYSKDAKFNDTQIVLGLIMDKEGRPIGLEHFPGNTFDGHTLTKTLKKLKEKFNIQKLILVGDRGICNKTNLDAIKAAEYEYIVGYPIKRASTKIQNEVIEQKNYKETESFKYKTVRINEKERLICTWSEKRAEKDKYDRERFIQKAEEILEGKRSLKQSGKAKYLKTENEIQGLNEEKIEADKLFDGYYAMQTNNEELSELQIQEAYSQLWRIEECFRQLKSHYEVRPVYHWNEDRIKGHLVVCFIAFLLERHLEIELKKRNLELSTKKLRKIFQELQISLVEIEGEEMIMRGAMSKEAKQLLKVLKIREPKNMQRREDFE